MGMLWLLGNLRHLVKSGRASTLPVKSLGGLPGHAQTQKDPSRGPEFAVPRSWVYTRFQCQNKIRQRRAVLVLIS